MTSPARARPRDRPPASPSPEAARPSVRLTALAGRRRGRRGAGLRHAIQEWLRSRAVRRHRRRLDQRTRVLRKVAQRPGLPAAETAFLVAALARHDRIVDHLRRHAVADAFSLEWRESVVASLERVAAGGRRVERLRAAMRGPLPTTVVEERLLAQTLAAGLPSVERAQQERQELLDELDRLAEELAGAASES